MCNTSMTFVNIITFTLHRKYCGSMFLCIYISTGSFDGLLLTLFSTALLKTWASCIVLQIVFVAIVSNYKVELEFFIGCTSRTLHIEIWPKITDNIFRGFLTRNNNGLRKVMGPPELFVDPPFLPTGCIFDLKKIMHLFLRFDLAEKQPVSNF